MSRVQTLDYTLPWHQCCRSCGVVDYRGDTDDHPMLSLFRAGHDKRVYVVSRAAVPNSNTSLLLVVGNAGVCHCDRPIMTKPRRSAGPTIKYRTCDACQSTLYFTDLESHFSGSCPPAADGCWTLPYVRDGRLHSFARPYTKGINVCLFIYFICRSVHYIVLCPSACRCRVHPSVLRLTLLNRRRSNHYPPNSRLLPVFS